MDCEDILSLIIPHLDIIDLMDFRCVNKQIYSIVSKYVTINKSKKLTNEYNGVTITKTYNEITGAYIRARSINGKLDGTSIYCGKTIYFMLIVNGDNEIVIDYNGTYSILYINNDCSTYNVNMLDIIKDYRTITFDNIHNYYYKGDFRAMNKMNKIIFTYIIRGSI